MKKLLVVCAALLVTGCIPRGIRFIPRAAPKAVPKVAPKVRPITRFHTPPPRTTFPRQPHGTTHGTAQRPRAWDRLPDVPFDAAGDLLGNRDRDRERRPRTYQPPSPWRPQPNPWGAPQPGPWGPGQPAPPRVPGGR